MEGETRRQKAHRKYLGELMIKEVLPSRIFFTRIRRWLLKQPTSRRSLAACKQAMLEPCTTDDVKGIWLMGPQVLVRATWSERLSHLSA